MRSGVVGMLPLDPKAVTETHARNIRALGFTGAAVFVANPLEVDKADYETVRTILETNGVAVAQCNGTYPVLVHPDRQARQEGIRALSRLCEIGSTLNADNVYVRPGSVNTANPWSPHPENTTPDTLGRLVDSLQQVCYVALSEGVRLAIEGHVVSPLNTPETTLELIQRVESSALGFNVDPVNYCGTLNDLFDTTSFLNRLFDILGRVTICGHVKDITVRNELVLHLDETLLGTGYMDLQTLVRRFEACCPDGYLLIEHIGDADIPTAKRVLDEAMDKAGMTWKA